MRAGADGCVFCGGRGSDAGSFVVDMVGADGVCETAITLMSCLNANCMKNCNNTQYMYTT